MNKLGISMIMLVAGSLFLGACGGQDEQNTDGTVTEQASLINTTHPYICPMHCENSASNEPGQCPVCGMELVKNPDYEGAGAAVDTPAAATADTTVDDKPGESQDDHGH